MPIAKLMRKTIMVVGILTVIVYILGILVGCQGADNDTKSESIKSTPTKTSKELWGNREELKTEFIDKVQSKIILLEEAEKQKPITIKNIGEIKLKIFTYYTEVRFLNEANKHNLTNKEKMTLLLYEKLLKRRQIREFPRLRDQYGPLLREGLWELNISARTIGNGYRTLQLTGLSFANNVNIKSFFEEFNNTFAILRFKRIEFRWYKGANEYTYYALKTHDDGYLTEE